MRAAPFDDPYHATAEDMLGALADPLSIYGDTRPWTDVIRADRIAEGRGAPGGLPGGI
jgi:hypothetical protein